jgi:hypothetical protein
VALGRGRVSGRLNPGQAAVVRTLEPSMITITPWDGEHQSIAVGYLTRRRCN